MMEKLPPEEVVITSDFNNDGRIDCFVSTYQDDAENCDGKPSNYLGVNLHVRGVAYALRCCGL